MKKAFIFYGKIFDYDNKQVTVGGIQTYLIELAKLLHDIGYNAWIIQWDDQSFIQQYAGVGIRGIARPKGEDGKNYYALFSAIKKEVDATSDLIIWGTDSIAYSLPGYITVSIQHGIGFDLVPYEDKWRRRLVDWGFGYIFKLLQRRMALKYFSKVKYRVCVDYNFLNWYRTFSLRNCDEHIFVIPNFTDIPEQYTCERIRYTRFLFARRFVEKRGVRIMLAAAEKLLANYPDVEFIFAGEGPLEKLIKDKIGKHPRVTITKYEHKETFKVHANADVAIIPTIGSEGTSLSLLEAMASGCAVICSNVGGMTNVIIDQYNGLMIEPTINELYKAMVKIHSNPLLGNRLARRGRETVEAGFSLSIWREKWTNVIDTVALNFPTSSMINTYVNQNIY